MKEKAKTYGKLTVGLIVAWFIFAASASAADIFTNASNGIGVAVGLAALVPILVFAVWFGASTSFRQFTLTLNPSILTVIQSARIFGFTFVLLQARGVLPAVFALPAGYGDMFIGATATLVAWKLASPAYRNRFILWQLLGVADLVTAVSLGTTAQWLAPHGLTTAVMTTLPLSLIPTFLVPLYLMLHIISIAQARGWKTASGRNDGSPVQMGTPQSQGV